MDLKRIAPEISVLILLGSVAGVLATMGPLRVRPGLAVRDSLPATIPGFTTEEVMHCQNSSCMRPVIFDSHDSVDACARCGSELDPWSLGEHRLLPEDTGLYRNVYRARDGRPFAVAIVISGAERTSIHRPQMCLTAGGHRINDSWPLAIPVSGRSPLVAEVLDLHHGFSGNKNVYAYWFASDRHETSSHWKRTWLMAKDNLLHGESGRWAYVSVLTPSSDSREDDSAVLESFIQTLMPYVIPAGELVGAASEKDDAGSAE